MLILLNSVPIVAIIRLVNMYRLLYLGEKSRRYNIAYVWTAVEINFAVMSCSMPALRPLFARLAPRLFGSSGAKTTGTPYANSHGQSANVTANGTKNGKRDTSMNYMLKDFPHGRKQTQTEIRGVSPSGSEEEIMTYNGILRTTNVNVAYEDAKRSDSGSQVSNDTRWNS